MKAIFAVSALAAAISTSAIAADSEWEFEFEGALDVEFVYDLEPADALGVDYTYDVDQVADDDDDEGTNFTSSMKVTNGPFSATVNVELDDDDGESDYLQTTLSVDDIIVTDGKFSFGQIGSLMETDEYAGDMGGTDTVTITLVGVDLDGDGNDDTLKVEADHVNDMDIGFRYEVMDGLKVQLEGLDDDGFTAAGVAAQYIGEAGAVSYVVEAEVAGSSVGAENDLDPEYFAGFGLSYSTDAVTVKAGLNAYQGIEANNTGTDIQQANIVEYAIEAETTVAGATLSAAWTEYSTNVEKDELLELDVSYEINAITLAAGYEFTTAEKAGDVVEASAEWSQDAWTASASVEIDNFDADTADDPIFDLDVEFLSEAGVTYYGNYEFQSDITNAVTAGARYAF